MNKLFLYAVIILLALLNVVLAFFIREVTQTGSSLPTYTQVFSAEPGPDIPTLQQIAGDATTDAEILDHVIDYFNENRERLSMLWQEENADRLAGLFSMYVIHISTIYGETSFPASLSEYLTQEHAHCGTYTYAQNQIVKAMGLTYRNIDFEAQHAWTEIYIDGHWEVFDATTNTWLDRGIEALRAGEPRQYRQFYTPLLDAERPDARLHINQGYDMPRLRNQMPNLGVNFFLPGKLNIGQPSETLE